MTYDRLLDLQEYLKFNIGCQVKIGRQTVSINEYPMILIIPDENGTIQNVKNSKFITYNFNVKLQIIGVDNYKMLIKPIKIMDDLLRVINNFYSEEGHILYPDFNTEYTENNYIITFIYQMNFRIQNT